MTCGSVMWNSSFINLEAVLGQASVPLELDKATEVVAFLIAAAGLVTPSNRPA